MRSTRWFIGAALAIALSACRDTSASNSCYSPTQNLDDAYEEGAEGCACKDEQAICVEREGKYLAFFCDAGDERWHAGFDGPCEVLWREKHCYSPTQNSQRSREPGAIGCACEEENANVCPEGGALLCFQGHWRAVSDGACHPLFGS